MTVAVALSHQGLFGTARDQLARPTCLAFSTSDCHAALRGSWNPLSVEFAHYYAQQKSGRSPTEGADIDGMLQAIERDGQPPEADWPYRPSLPADLRTWLPPKNIKAVYKRSGRREPPLFDNVLRGLNDGRPIILGMTLSIAFYQPDGNGIIVGAPGEAPDPAIRHAVVAVAHGTWKKEPMVLVRNSWGAAWGLHGYGWLAKSYLDPRLFMAAILTEDPDVSTNKIATNVRFGVAGGNTRGKRERRARSP